MSAALSNFDVLKSGDQTEGVHKDFSSTLINRFSKPLGKLYAHKVSFFNDNDDLVKEDQPKFAKYLEQPKRTECKNCANPIANCPVIFNLHGGDWHQCNRCDHVFGANDDTEEYAFFIYASDGGDSYGANYAAQNRDKYWSRVNDIYVPKVDFLFEALQADGMEAPTSLDFSDFGSGTGHMAASLLTRGVSDANVHGFDVSDSAVKAGNEMIQLEGKAAQDVLKVVGMEDLLTIAKEIKSNVVSMVGVIEHVRWPRQLVQALQENPAVQYFYISVPCYSIASFFELSNPETYHRQVEPGHTHLYTNGSLHYLAEEFGMERIAEWWFGADAMDLHRHLTVDLIQSKGQPGAADAMGMLLLPVLDDLQAVFDKSRTASEVHMLFKFNRD